MKDPFARVHHAMKRRATKVAALAALAAMVSQTACGNGAAPGQPSDAGAACPRDLPSTCQGTAPTYAQDIAPVLASRCLSCHGEGGVENASVDLTTYDGVYRKRTDVLSQVYNCQMPLPDAGAPSADERALLMNWVVCGAPP